MLPLRHPLHTAKAAASIDQITGWITYLRPLDFQEELIRQWHNTVEAASPGTFKPFALLYKIDLVADPDVSPTPIHNGHRLGRSWLMRHLEALERAGANQVPLNLKFESRPVEAVLDELATYIVPRFPALGAL